MYPLFGLLANSNPMVGDTAPPFHSHPQTDHSYLGSADTGVANIFSKYGKGPVYGTGDLIEYSQDKPKG